MRECDTQTELLQRLDVRLVEGMHKQTAGNIFPVVTHLNITVAAIFNAIEISQLIGEEVAPQFSVNLNTHITIRNELRRQTAFDEQQVRTGLQTLQTYGFLELAHLELH